MEEEKKSSEKINPLGKEEPEFKIDVWSFIFLGIGSGASWINMLIILDSMEVWSYLTIIFTTIIPGIIIGLKNRFWAYGYILGFSIAGIPFIFIDLFIGGYTFATALFIFIILYLIFFKTWRSISAIKK